MTRFVLRVINVQTPGHGRLRDVSLRFLLSIERVSSNRKFICDHIAKRHQIIEALLQCIVDRCCV